MSFVHVMVIYIENNKKHRQVISSVSGWDPFCRVRAAGGGTGDNIATDTGYKFSIAQKSENGIC